jgi:hypothetical protein
MDKKTQMIIYAIDALECSIRSNLRMIKTLKSLMAPEPCSCDLKPEPGDEPLYPAGMVLNTVPSINQVKISTFEPPASVTFPPCLHCTHDCTLCSELDECHELHCCICKFQHICVFRISN